MSPETSSSFRTTCCPVSTSAVSSTSGSPRWGKLSGYTNAYSYAGNYVHTLSHTIKTKPSLVLTEKEKDKFFPGAFTGNMICY